MTETNGRTHSRGEAEKPSNCAHYALEEAEYGSALKYIGEAEKELSEARKAIEPEMRPSEKVSHGEQQI